MHNSARDNQNAKLLKEGFGDAGMPFVQRFKGRELRKKE